MGTIYKYNRCNFFNMSFTYTAYSLKNYHFGKNKPPKKIKDATYEDRLIRIRERIEQNGSLLSVYGVMIVMQYKTPHLIVINGPQENRYELPGGQIKYDKYDKEGLKQKLDKQMLFKSKDLKFDWKIGELLGIFYRPSHQNFILPYLPPHVSKVKEVFKLYFVQLPEVASFSISKNQNVIAVPIFDLFDNAFQWGNVFVSIPGFLSRLNIDMCKT